MAIGQAAHQRGELGIAVAGQAGSADEQVGDSGQGRNHHHRPLEQPLFHLVHESPDPVGGTDRGAAELHHDHGRPPSAARSRRATPAGSSAGIGVGGKLRVATIGNDVPLLLR